MRKLFALLLALAMVISIVPMAAYASDGTVVDNGDGTWTNYYDGHMENKEHDINGHVEVAGGANYPDGDYMMWRFNDSRADGDKVTPLYAVVVFTDGVNTYEIRNDHPATNSGNQARYFFATPANWTIAQPWNQSYGVSEGDVTGQQNFNCSCWHVIPPYGWVTVSGAVNASHDEVTPVEHYLRDAEDVYVRDVTDNYENYEELWQTRTVDIYNERTVDEFFHRIETHVFQRDVQDFYIPVFERRMGGNYKKDTLVTRLNYSDNTAKATPTNGGAFKNGHTYVTVNVADASQDGGVWYTIADSSKNNGKKTPDQYNRPIDYQYNVKIADGKLTVSCGDDLAFASVGAEIWAKAPTDAKNAPKHYDGSVTVDVPKNNGTVDLYVHFENLGWYATDENGDFIYDFKEWRFDHTDVGEYAEIENSPELSDWILYDTQYGEYEWVRTDCGDYVTVDSAYSDYEYVDTTCGDYEFVKTIYGDYELVNTTENRVSVADTYEGTYTLSVDGEPVNEGERLELRAGQHTLTISGDDFDSVTTTFTVVAGEDTTAHVVGNYQGADVTLETQVDEQDRAHTRLDTDNVTEPTYTTHEAEGDRLHQDDLEATIHNDDKTPVRHETENVLADDKYLPDNKLPDEHLGNEHDPYGEHAVRISD